MNQIMFNLITENYNELFDIYCKYKNKNVLSNSLTCEDIFNQKILYFLECDIEEPTIETLKFFLKTKRKNKAFKSYEFKEYYIDKNQVEEIDERIKLLFIDYRPEKKNKKDEKRKR